MQAVSELDNSRAIIASADEIVMVLCARAGEVRDLMPRVAVDLDHEIVSPTDRSMAMPAAQIRLGREPLGVAAEQVTDQCQQLQKSHARVTLGRVRPVPQLGTSSVDQVHELWPVRGASVVAHWLTRMLMGTIIRTSTASGTGRAGVVYGLIRPEQNRRDSEPKAPTRLKPLETQSVRRPRPLDGGATGVPFGRADRGQGTSWRSGPLVSANCGVLRACGPAVWSPLKGVTALAQRAAAASTPELNHTPT